MLEVSSIYAAAVDSGGVGSCNLHSHIVSQLLAAAGEVNQHANLAAHVDVGSNLASALIASETAEGNLLADGSSSLDEQIGNLLALDLAVIQSVNIAGSNLSLHDVLGNLGHQSLELVVASSEVGLAVDLNYATALGILGNISTDSTLSSHTASLLLSLGNALLAKEVDGLGHVAAYLSQSLLAVHHACAGGLAQFLYHSSSNCHLYFLLKHLINTYK